MKLQTTLNIIRAAQPCADGWAKLLKSLPVGFDHDAHISFAHILACNGMDDALWALGCVIPEQEGQRDREARLFACDCAESVFHIFAAKFPDDKHYRTRIDVARRFANGNATRGELDAARDASRDAAWAAGAAARTAAGAAAWDAAGAAAWAAAGDAGAAAGAARTAAGDSEKRKQEEQFRMRFCTQEDNPFKK